MSLTPSAQRAIGWIEQHIADLGGIRNATPRDPSFKNWRQAALTTMQRIWPGDQDRSERFRRIPFSPVDPRADARTVREWYSRGCQEATRVLQGFIDDVRANGVPDQAAGTLEPGADVAFATDFPTVDLPAGDLSTTATPTFAPSPNTFSQFVDDATQGQAPNAPAPPSLPSEIPAIQNPVAHVRPNELAAPPARPAEPAAPQAPGPQARPQATPAPKKGMGARLKDLLGFAQLSAKALAGFPKDQAPPTALPSLDAPMNPTRSSMDVMPLGGAVSNDAGRAAIPSGPSAVPISDEDVPHAPKVGEPVPSAPPKLAVPLPTAQPGQPGAPGSGLWPLPQSNQPETPLGAPLPPAANAPPAPMSHEPGKSVVMSRPTTLRSAIEKVSIESLLSDQFRDPAAQAPATPQGPEALEQMVNDMLSAEAANTAPSTPTPPAAVTPAPPAATPSPPTATPPAAAAGTAGQDSPSRAMPVIPLFQQVKTAPPPRPTAPPANAPAASVPSESAAAPPAPSENEPREASADAPPPSPGDSRLIQMPPRDPDARPRGGSLVSESGAHKVDPEAFARATDDFMRTSPVLGATGRKVQRPNEDTGFDDPDAIAVASMVHDLARLDVPAGRQPELRARLLDLARRIEQGELDWSALRKAVWFAMEYPELARRLMPVLLPWIDRAA